MRFATALLFALLTAFPATADAPVDCQNDGWVRWSKAKFRQMVTGSADGADGRFGIRADESWRTASAETSRVVLVHGFNTAPSSMAPLAEKLRRRGHPCAMVCYPNDQAIDRTAKRVAHELRPIVRSAGGAKVAVVTHSMGGLVARRVLEDPRLDPGGVDRLIMIAPPNHGSTLARLSIGTDVYEHAMLAKNAARKTGIYHSIDDGLGEATHDLRPGSPFLKRLNARPRNPRVAYTIILGDRGRFTDEQLEQLRESFASARSWRRPLGWLAPRVEKVLAECEEVVIGKGDGAVSLYRGRLAGVNDTHILHATHDLIDLRGETGPELLALVTERL